MKFLLDANLSPETTDHLVAALSLDVTDLLTTKQGTISDNDVVALAKAEERVIITFDLDFGEIYFTRERGRIGVIILRLADQTVEAVNRVLTAFFAKEASSIDLSRSLVIIEERRIRIRSASS